MDAAAHEFWQDAPIARAGPRDMREMQDRRVRHFATDGGGRQVKVIVLKEDVRRFRVLSRLVYNSFSYRFVDGNIAAFPGLIHGAADIRGSRRVPHEVLYEPEQRVAEDVIVAL